MATPDALPPTGAPPEAGWRGWLRALSPRALAWVIPLAIAGAAVLKPIFEIPFTELVGRAVFVALVCLLAFHGAGQLHRRARRQRLPRWLVQVIALVLAAPVATVAVYLFATGGDFVAFVGNEHRVSGFVFIAGTATIAGLLMAMGAMLRERDAQARALQLQLELERTRAERQTADARLAMLTAQVQPHFLFNTLANVQALVESGSPRAATVLRSLTAYLRAALPRLAADGGMPALDNELALVRAYLELMHLRMPDRLRYRFAVDPATHAVKLPPMALLTLVENAVHHGIDPAEDGGEIEVGARREGDAVVLWVQDSGVGMAPRAAPGMGLGNLRDRLASAFGAAAALTLSEAAPHGVRAEIRLPAAG